MDRLMALAVFKAVAENGSFAAAASALDISRPVVTRIVQDLESLLGVKLLHRSTRHLALTAVGEDVLLRTGDLLQSFDELASIGRLSANEPAGLIRMAAVSIARHTLGPTLARFHAHFPRVQVDLQLCEGSVNTVLPDVDLALCLPEDIRPTQVARLLTRVEVGTYASPEYLALRGEPTHPAHLAGHDCLTSRIAGTKGTWSFESVGGGEACAVDVHGSLLANQTEVLADAASCGAGIVMLPVSMAQAAVAEGRLKRILLGWRLASPALQLAYHSRRHQPMSVRKLIEHLLDTLGTPPQGRDTAALHVAGNETQAIAASPRAMKTVVDAAPEAKFAVRQTTD